MSKSIPLTLYKKIHAAMPITCVDIVILHGDSVLLCKRLNEPAQGKYWFPGGRVLKGETLVAAAKRKVKEETGLSVKIIKQLGTEETMFADGPFGGPTHTINIIFLAVCEKPGKLKSDDQSSDLDWFSKLPSNSHSYVRRFTQLALTTRTLIKSGK